MARELDRRQFLGLLVASGSYVVVKAIGIDSIFPQTARAAEPSGAAFLSHAQVLDGFQERAIGSEAFLSGFKSLMVQTAQKCVVSQNSSEGKRDWVVPSRFYDQYLFSRDSFWVLAALRDRDLSQTVVDRFKEDQRFNDDGHIATALLRDGSRPENRDRDEESTITYVLQNYLLKQLGGTVDKESLEKAYGFISSHVVNGRYVTYGERRRGPAFGGISELGTYHYWVDTFRPSGREEATPEVIAYNQGLYCVALNCLENMGLSLPPQVRQEAENVYANMVNPEDGVSLPQREGSTIMDVSSLVGEAMSTYFFDRSILGRERVGATLDQLSKVYYPDGRFLGFKVISDYYGGYRPNGEFTVLDSNTPGNYQNGGSWMLYDSLALYAGARHNLSIETPVGRVSPEALLLERFASEVRISPFSHEYLSTNRLSLGRSEVNRDNYGWNSFVANLLP